MHFQHLLRWLYFFSFLAVDVLDGKTEEKITNDFNTFDTYWRSVRNPAKVPEASATFIFIKPLVICLILLKHRWIYSSYTLPRIWSILLLTPPGCVVCHWFLLPWPISSETKAHKSDDVTLLPRSLPGSLWPWGWNPDSCPNQQSPACLSTLTCPLAPWASATWPSHAPNSPRCWWPGA